MGGWRGLPKAVGGGYCRLRVPLLPLAFRETVPGRRLGALEVGGHLPVYPRNSTFFGPIFDAARAPRETTRHQNIARHSAICGPWPGGLIGEASAMTGPGLAEFGHFWPPQCCCTAQPMAVRPHLCVCRCALSCSHSRHIVPGGTVRGYWRPTVDVSASVLPSSLIYRPLVGMAWKCALPPVCHTPPHVDPPGSTWGVVSHAVRGRGHVALEEGYAHGGAGSGCSGAARKT